MTDIPSNESEKQEYYREARYKKYYDGIWQSTGKCVFCDLREKYIIAEEAGMVLTITLYAYIDGDMMIVPRRHVTTTTELTQREWEAVRKLSYIARKLIRDTHGIRGMQFIQRHGGIQAQSTVEHLHIKCVPFDAPDLSVWNYRKLKHTPLENTALYKEHAKRIAKLDQKFDEKAETTSYPVVCDIVLRNVHNEILFQERKAAYKFVPDLLTLPGGTVHDFSHSFEHELAREVKEEVSLELDITKFTIVSSRISKLKYTKHNVHTDTSHIGIRTFVQNTYTYPTLTDVSILQPGDDCEGIVWIPQKEVASHPRISSEVQETIAKLPL